MRMVRDTPEPPEPGVKVEYVMVKGDPGQDGADGVDGVDGQDGQDGQDGAQGPVGPAGSGMQCIEKVYASPQLVWEHEHGLNRFAVWAKLLDLDRTEKEGAVETPDENNIRVEWYRPEAGIFQIFY